jgi:HPt (histidine-containing phosphotransfer) domain-containing protein
MSKIIVKVDHDIKELIPGFIVNRYEDIKLLNIYLEKRDFESIVRLGHSMKGFGAGYGFDAISLIGEQLEDAAKNELTKEISYQIDALLEYMEQVEIAYE